MKKQEPKISLIASEPSSLNSSSPTSLSYPYQLENLATSMLKSVEWLGELRELHYVPFNSPNSLTIYSYTYWPRENRLFVATKENNLKEVAFKQCSSYSTPIGLVEHNLESTETIYSSRSSESGDAQKATTTGAGAREPNQNNSTLTDDTSHLMTSSMIHQPGNTTASSLESAASYLEPSLKIHKFPRIKSEALISSIDIIDMDTFNVFVVSFVLKRKILTEQFFVHLYSDFKTCNFEQLLECGQEYELDVLPHRVSHLRLIRRSDSSSERLVSHEDRQISTSFIMVNCSQRINVFYSIDAKNRRFDQVVKIEDFFVEFKHENFVDNCTSHDIKYLDSSGKSNEQARAKHRLTALGFQNGALSIFLVDADKNEILKSFKHENDSFISQVQFFTTKSYRDWSKIDADKTPINLLVLRSLEPTRVINDVFHAQSEQDEFQDLEISHFCDLVTSAVVYDATFSGYNSIVLGTFGKVACFFCPVLVDAEPTDEADGGPGSGGGGPAGDASKSSSTSSTTRASGFFKPGTKTFRYELKRELLFKHSILGLYACKLSSNGAYDLAVLTLNGISIWQYDPDSLVELINQKYQQHEKTITEAIASRLSTNVGPVEL